MTDRDARKSGEELTSQVLRKRRGGVAKETMARNRESNRIRRQIVDLLKAGPKTVPEIADATGIPSPTVFWHLMSMRKYGKVVEGEERDSYFEYALGSGEDKT